MNRRIILCFFFLLFILGIHAQKNDKISFRVDVPDEVLIGEVFRLNYILEGAEGRNFSVSDKKLDNAELVYGPSTSTSVLATTDPETRSRRTEYSLTYSYGLRATEKGTITIPVATIEVDGKKYSTKSRKVKVVESKHESSKKDKKETKKTEVSDSDVFIETIVSRRAAGVGEPIEITYRLYLSPKMEVERVIDSSFPRFSGFSVKREVLDNRDFKEEKLKGKTYKVLDLNKYIIRAQATGNYTIEPVNLSLLIDPDKEKDKSGMDRRERYNSMVRKSVASEKIIIIVGSAL